MWTKEQVWDFLMLVGSIAFLSVTGVLALQFGLTILLINAPVGLAGLFLHLMFRRTLNASRAQAEQAQRHLAEMSEAAAEQERISKDLEKSEEKFRNAFDHAAVGMALVAPAGQLLKVNQSFCDILGYSPEELVKLDFQTLLDKEDLYSFNVGLAKLFEGNQTKSQSEERVKHKQGHTIWLRRDTSLVKGTDDNTDSTHFIFQLQDITERKRAEERLNHDALHDALTGLPNRALFTDRLRVACQSARRHPNNQFAVLFLDIDKLKRLMVIARRLEAGLRAGDTAARFAGDEFVVLVGDVATAEEAGLIADEMQKTLSQPFNINGQEIVLTFSIGIAMWSRDYDDSEILLRDADTALSEAKRLGRGRAQVFAAEMHKQEQQLLQLETDLSKALERNEFLLYYQPVVDLNSNGIKGFEALIRWQHPTRGLVSPADFLAVGEEMGLNERIGLWVMREAARQLSAWRLLPSFSPDLWMSVNLSGKQFLQADLVNQIAGILQETALPPHLLNLEVAESVIVENTETAVDKLKRLKRLGINLSIDDFGKGYSSLNQLLNLPLDYLKIDPSFVKSMLTVIESRDIVKTIVSFAQKLNLQVIAEGIETRRHIFFLKALDCRLGQGYFFAKPYPAAAIERLFQQQHKQIPQDLEADNNLNGNSADSLVQSSVAA
jgi:PAS domain S-box-containing protein/diguanylate cyclase (GGDEF)-like protein